jgi:transcriptional regulator with XRE-family HTH domain
MQAMARTRDIENETICRNLRAFRATAGMSQDEAASASGVAIDNLRRYESGAVTAPAAALRRLGEIYGHAMEDFFSDHPPAAKLDDRPVLFLRSLPGVEVDKEFLDKAHKVIAQVNAEFRERKKSSRKR